MAGRIPQHVLQQIARGVDFVRLAGRYLQLKKRGKSYWALCPFHDEKTPSFSIDPDNGLYYCFGCKEGGNVFTFLQKMEGLSFGDALRKLAEEAGVDISQYRSSDGSSDETSRLREALELATSFYQKCLQKARGSKEAKEYLEARQINAESIERWRLGYAPDGWDNLLNCATGRDYEPSLLERAGLVKAREGAEGHYDRFRKRIIFPITDVTGRPIGFGARVLDPEDEPKYLNSPETPLFSKRRCFFGLAEARSEVRSADTAVIVEGYTDVIMAHQAGVRGALAVLGTALTEEHARRLSRLCGRAILVFDPDEAGQKSAARSAEVLLNEEMEVRIAQLPAGLDPCDCITEHGAEAFRERLEESVGFFEHRLSLARGRHGTDTLDGRMAAFREVAELALALGDPARREMVVRWVADELNIRPRAVWIYLERQSSRTTTPSPGTNRGRGQEEERHFSADRALPGEVLGLLLANPELAREAAQRIELELLREGPEKEALRRWLEFCRQEEPPDPRQFAGALAEPDVAAAASKALAEEKVRERRIRQVSHEERLKGYLEFLEAKRMAQESSQALSPEELGDAALKELERRLKKKDKQSAEKK